MTLGDKIYQLRTQVGLSQEELAEKTGVSRQSVSKWETGASIPELDKLIQLAKTFGITLDALVQDESAQTIPESVSDDPHVSPEKAQATDVNKSTLGKLSHLILGCALMIGGILLTTLSLLKIDNNISGLILAFPWIGIIMFFIGLFTAIKGFEDINPEDKDE